MMKILHPGSARILAAVLLAVIAGLLLAACRMNEADESKSLTERDRTEVSGNGRDQADGAVKPPQPVAAGSGGEEGRPGAGAGSASRDEATLVIGAYSVLKDAFAEILPAFREEWQAKTGQSIRFQESYEASGTQARAIAGGFEADVAALSMETDMDKIVRAGLLSEDWRAREYGGMVTSSVVAIGTREGNPHGIRDWSDLTADGIGVLYPNPRTSGGAMWVINAIYGAGLEQSKRENGERDPEFALRLLAGIHRNVESMGKSGRASMATFEYGFGDAILTYENELLARVRQGVPYEIIVPDHTIRIDNPVAVVDKNADRHGVREAAEAFVQFLYSDQAQHIFAKHGFRPVVPHIAGLYEDEFTAPPGLFTIDDLGGWDRVLDEIYGKGGVWDRVLMGM